MPDTPWKAFERRVAKQLGGNRTGPLGKGKSDVDGTSFSVECKRTSRLGINGSWIRQARDQGRKEGRPWILVVSKHNDRRPVVVLDFGTFVKLATDFGLVESMVVEDSVEVEHEPEEPRSTGRARPHPNSRPGARKRTA
jgi:hypothetical protein